MVYVLLDDARDAAAEPAQLFRAPKRIISANRATEIPAALTAMRNACAEGHHLAGYCSYPFGAALEPALPNPPPGAPLLWFGVFDAPLLLDAKKLAAFLPDGRGAWLGKLHPEISREQYAAAFAQVQEHIRAGDIYQANLTFRATASLKGPPLALYAALRERSKAGFGAVIDDDARSILSFSPELFFSLDAEGIATRPMKGTAARATDLVVDARRAEALTNDPKQRAENLMIVDLLRNDLSRIAVAGSVAVPALFSIESYPTVHQMTSTITAQLSPGKDVIDIIAAMFPCGSITGAPKIRAMEIIDEIETTPRDIYCGSIGRIDPGGDAAFNVAIRTLVIPHGADKVSLGLGSGVVADSTAGAEWQECLAKGEFAKVTGPMPDLFETMAFAPATGIARLEAHLARLTTSAAALEFSFDRHAARNALQAVCFHLESPSRVRLMLAQSGAFAIHVAPVPAMLSEPIICDWRPLLASPDDYRLHHKTSDRRVYGDGDTAHCIFYDADGFATEGAIWNIFVERDDKLLTPPQSRGLLPGILRGALLEEGRAVEADLRREDLGNGFWVGNALRGLMRAELRD